MVGAGYDDSWTGADYVFERNQGGADNWGQVTKLTASDGETWDWFGYAVAISGNTIVAGALYDDGGDDSGSAYVYQWTVAKVYLPLVLRGF